MNTIQEEYSKLSELSKSRAGWSRIQDAWCTACNEKKRDGHWYVKGASKGLLVEGFAIDSKTKHHMTCSPMDHSAAYWKMTDWIKKKEPSLKKDDILGRTIKGWLAKILDFEFPCIMMSDVRFIWEPDYLKEIEEAILTQEIGLPLNRLFINKA